MKTRPLHVSLASLVFACAATLCTADTAADLAKQSRADFLAEYELRFMQSVVLQRELLNRVSDGLGETGISDDPVTNEERASFECTYDYMDERDQLDLLAMQIISFDLVSEMAAEDPAFDFVNLVFEDAVLEEVAGAVPEAAFEAMSNCGQLTVSRDRMNFTPELWAAVTEQAQARGFAD